jgi:hypothetical protein
MARMTMRDLRLKVMARRARRLWQRLVAREEGRAFFRTHTREKRDS